MEIEVFLEVWSPWRLVMMWIVSWLQIRDLFTYVGSAHFTLLFFLFLFISVYRLYGCWHTTLIQLFIIASLTYFGISRNMKPFSLSTWILLARPWMNFWRLTLEILQLVLCCWRSWLVFEPMLQWTRMVSLFNSCGGGVPGFVFVEVSWKVWGQVNGLQRVKLFQWWFSMIDPNPYVVLLLGFTIWD